MKKLLLFIGLAVASASYGQAGIPSEDAGANNIVYMGQDENGYPIYKNVRPFESIGSKIAISLFSVFGTALTIKIVRDRKEENELKEAEEKAKNRFMQKDVEI